MERIIGERLIRNIRGLLAQLPYTAVAEIMTQLDELPVAMFDDPPPDSVEPA